MPDRAGRCGQRGDICRATHPGRPDVLRARRDGGFTLIEVLVAIALIGTVMTALVPFLVQSLGVVTTQRIRQVAVKLAEDGIERARALTPGATLAGRSQTASTAAWQNAYDQLPAVRPYLDTMKLAWDTLLPSGSTSGASAALPTTGVVARINGVDYTQNWYLGECRQQLGRSGSCDNPTAPDPDPARADVPFLRVVVAVKWTDRTCPGEPCTYLATTLMSAATDPCWTVIPAPVVADPGNQVSLTGVDVSLPMKVTKAVGKVTWTAVGLPAGLAIDANTGIISGRPSATSTVPDATVTVTATDTPGCHSGVTFKWTIRTLAIATWGTRSNEMRDSVNIAGPAVTGGTGPYTYTMTGAPGEPGDVTIDPNTGRITGSLDHANRYLTTITVTDAKGEVTSTTFIWYIEPDHNNDLGILVPDPHNPDQTSRVGQAVNLMVEADHGSSSGYTWSATGLPPGLTIGPTVARFYAPITGTPTTAGVYKVTLTAQDSPHKLATVMFYWTVTS